MRHGFLLIDKPAGVTSHDVVAQVRRILHERHIGHLGTLDPAATGLLVLAVGNKALKVVELFGVLTKEYEADVRFGMISSTYDGEGVMEEKAPPMGWEPPEQGTVQRIIADRFLGKIQQVPPAHSAVHIGGERAYRKARQGRGVNIPPRDVEIHRCDILLYDYPLLRLRVTCGSGTYIRSLAHDLGEILRPGAYLEKLRRTKVGEWSIDQAISPEKGNWVNVMPLKDVMVDLPRRDLTESEFEDLTFGRVIEADVPENAIGWLDELPVVVLRRMGEGVARARKVL